MFRDSVWELGVEIVQGFGGLDFRVPAILLLPSPVSEIKPTGSNAGDPEVSASGPSGVRMPKCGTASSPEDFLNW